MKLIRTPLYDFDNKDAWSQIFKSECKNCGKVIEVSTQKDDNPEYYTEVNVKCVCGGSAQFELPVN